MSMTALPTTDEILDADWILLVNDFGKVHETLHEVHPRTGKTALSRRMRVLRIVVPSLADVPAWKNRIAELRGMAACCVG